MMHFNYHFCSIRNLETHKYFSSPYFFLIALSLELGREMFWRAKHMSLKHFIKVYFSIF